MKTAKIQEALREAKLYIGDRSAGSAPFWDALDGAESELDALAIQKANAHAALRDYFAAAALTGIASQQPCDPETDAGLAYEYADAMLKAREGK